MRPKAEWNPRAKTSKQDTVVSSHSHGFLLLYPQIWYLEKCHTTLSDDLYYNENDIVVVKSRKQQNGWQSCLSRLFKQFFTWPGLRGLGGSWSSNASRDDHTGDGIFKQCIKWPGLTDLGGRSLATYQGTSHHWDSPPVSRSQARHLQPTLHPFKSQWCTKVQCWASYCNTNDTRMVMQRTLVLSWHACFPCVGDKHGIRQIMYMYNACSQSRLRIQKQKVTWLLGTRSYLDTHACQLCIIWS